MSNKIMKDKSRFTKKEILVVIGCAVFLLISIGAIGSGGRGKAKRLVCLANLKQLTLVWNMYADENDGKIVNGEASEGANGTAPVPRSGMHKGELWWTGDGIAPGYMIGETLPEDIQLKAIRAGALWPYCGDVKLYRCPSGAPSNMRHYTIVDSMNGLHRNGTYAGNSGVIVGETVLWIKNKTDIRIPGPSQRIVFIDEGRTTPDSYAVHYLNESWWDPPPVRHGEGTNLSFADGHAEPWTWQGKKTIETGRMANPWHQMQPETPEDFQDLYRMQKGVWGRLGYVPSH